VTPNTIRFHERTGLLPAPARTIGDHRRYHERAIARLQFIRGGGSACGWPTSPNCSHCARPGSAPVNRLPTCCGGGWPRWTRKLPGWPTCDLS